MKQITLLLFTLMILGCRQEPLQVIAEQTFHYNHEIFEENNRVIKASHAIQKKT